MSKINTEYWGANVSPGSASGYTLHVGLSTNNIRNLIAQGKYNPNTDSFDLSVSPWGIGASAAGRYGVIGVFRDGSIDGSTPGKISKIKFLTDDENRNMPFTLAIKPDTLSPATNNTWTYNRINGGIVVDENNYMCNTDYDGTTAGVNLPSGSTTNTYSNIQVPTYLDYSAIRLLIYGFYWLNTATGATGRYTFSAATMATAKTNWNNWSPSDPENIVITGIEITAIANSMYSGSPTSWSGTPVNKTPIIIPLKPHKMNELSYLWNGGGVDDSSKWIGIAPWTIGLQNTYYSTPDYNEIQTGYLSRFIPVDEQRYTSSTTPTLSQVWRYGFRTERTSNPVYSNYSDEKHVFSDVTYKMRPLVWNVINGLFVEFREGQTLSNTQQQLRISSIYDVETSSGDWKNTLMSILLHEVAFYGFPFSIHWQSVNYSNAYAIGSDECYLPVFDEHLVTTGNYMSGTESLELPNSTWRNVFDDSMPEYDPTYQPPKPDGKDNEKDGGFLNNSNYRGVKLAGSNEFYAMNVNELRTLMTFINGMYQGDDDDTQLKIDFKGSNPNDYIVGVFAYPFNIPNTQHLSNVYIGPVETNVQANVVDKDQFGYLTFGSIYVDGDPLGFHGDFRDYEPYTQIELYLPMVGTAKLDPSYYVGHLLTVNYIYDINTGSLSAQILRDNTIDKIIESTLPVQIPITARDMGSYQNNLYQMKMNLLNTAVHGAASGITQTVNAATKGTDINGLINAPVSGFDYGSQFSQTIYEMKHIQPAIAQTSTASPANGMQFYNNCVLFVKHLKMLDDFDPENYGKTIGYACLMNKQLSDVSGFTVCANADLSGIPATADEINAIQAALQSGIYL